MRVFSVLVLSQACSSATLAFAPALQKTRFPVALTTTRTAADTKPYFVDFSTETVNNSDVASSSIPTINGSNDKVGLGKTAVVAGATGYIGRACVRECVARGYNTIALVRDPSRASSDEALAGASLVECDVTNMNEVQNLLKEIAIGNHAIETNNNKLETGNPPPVDMVISCLASPSGIESDVYAIDYQATLNLLNAGSDTDVSARHFVLLSAFCCRNPILKV